MAANIAHLGGFTFEQQGDQMLLRTPTGAASAGQAGFVRGIQHLLTMGMDLEGQAEIDGGLVFRVEGERVQLKLGGHSEYFRLDEVAALFRRLAAGAG
jgi:hypothetical protein